MQQLKSCWMVCGTMVVLSVVLLLSCSNSVSIPEDQSDEMLFQQGQQYYEQKEYKKALMFFEYVKDNFLRSPYAGATRFYAGECYYEQAEYDSAAVSYQSFLTFFPKDQLAPAAQYRLGLCYLHQALDPERDQTMINDALEELEKVIQNYSDNTEYVQKAAAKITEIKEKAALAEFAVAQFYRTEKNYRASNGRALFILKNYPAFSMTADVLLLSGQNYVALNQSDEAKAAFLKLLQVSPASQAHAIAREQLGMLGVADVPAPPAGVSAPAQEVAPPQAEASPETSAPAAVDSDRGYIVLKRDPKLFINLTRTEGLREGMELEVTRENQVIGIIRIVEIQEGFSLAEIVSVEPNMTIREEDRVRLSQP